MNLKEIIMILIISIIILFIISPDFANENLMDNTITSNISEKMNISDVYNTSDVIFIDKNGNPYVKNESDVIVMSSSDKVYTEKTKQPQKPTITMTGKPSCTRCARNGCSYTWRTKTYINYCPNCHHYNCLGNKHKRGAVYEQEITCFRCDSDFCVNCGKEKYSWSSKYLQKC